MKQLGSTDLKRLHRTWRRNTPTHNNDHRLALILAGLSQPHNVGAIFRTAAAYRINDVWLAGDMPNQTNSKVARTALGSERFFPLHHTDDAQSAISQARSDGYTIVGLELADDAVPLHLQRTNHDTCLVIGHEDRGLTQPVLDACESVAFLPQLGKIGSLNVATATSIAIYELRRQSWTES